MKTITTLLISLTLSLFSTSATALDLQYYQESRLYGGKVAASRYFLRQAEKPVIKKKLTPERRLHNTVVKVLGRQSNPYRINPSHPIVIKINAAVKDIRDNDIYPFYDTELIFTDLRKSLCEDTDIRCLNIYIQVAKMKNYDIAKKYFEKKILAGKYTDATESTAIDILGHYDTVINMCKETKKEPSLCEANEIGFMMADSIKRAI